MSYAEFCDWVAFHLEHPFDDEHRYHRPAALLSQSMAGGKIEDRLHWLKDAAVKAEVRGRWSKADLETFAAFGVKPPEV